MSRRSATVLRAAIGVLLFSSLAGGGCASCNPAYPDPPRLGPRDPGTVVVRVNDDTGAPVANALVEVTQPNSVGGQFRVGARTNASGTVTVAGIPAGARPIDVKPPAGYKAGPNGTTQTVTVTKDKITVVTFTLARDVTSAARTTAGVPST